MHGREGNHSLHQTDQCIVVMVECGASSVQTVFSPLQLIDTPVVGQVAIHSTSLLGAVEDGSSYHAHALLVGALSTDATP